MTINPVRRIAVLSVALVAIAGLASCSSTETKAKTDVKKVSKRLHADVVRAYDDAKSGLDKAGDKIGDTSRSAYDKSKKDLESLGADLDDAYSRTGHDAKRAYRKIHHRLGTFDHAIDRHLHNGLKDFEAGETDSWSDIKDGYHRVKDSIDHVIDDLT